MLPFYLTIDSAINKLYRSSGIHHTEIKNFSQQPFCQNKKIDLKLIETKRQGGKEKPLFWTNLT